MKLGIAGPIFVSPFPDSLCSAGAHASLAPSGVTVVPVIHSVASCAPCEIPWSELRKRLVPSASDRAHGDASVT